MPLMAGTETVGGAEEPGNPETKMAPKGRKIFDMEI